MRRCGLLVHLALACACLLHVAFASPVSQPDAPQPDDPTPIQQRIALLPSGMTVSWSTVGPLPTPPSVSYGLSPASLNLSATGVSLHYDPSVTHFHHVPLRQLLPHTRYYWQVTSPAKLVNATALSFVTALLPGDPTPFTVAINGDMGLVNEDVTLATMKQFVLDDRIDLFWHIGDLSYADDWALQLSTYERVTETWMDRQTDLWSTRPYMVLPGNHEATCTEILPAVCPEGQRNFTSFLQRYRMPAEESGSVNNMYYSWDAGLVHFVSIDTEVGFPDSPEGPGTRLGAGPFGGDQLQWLEADLRKAAANRWLVPWIVVAGHRPWYSSAGGDKQVGEAFEPLLLRYAVDAVFLGHIHWTERLWPVANGTVVARSYEDVGAPAYIVVASAGNVEGLQKSKGREAFTAFVDDQHFGMGVLTVQNATHLQWTFYDSDTREALDNVTIIKSARFRERQAETRARGGAVDAARRC